MATDLGYLALIGFASLRLTEFYKEITNRIGIHQPGWWKSMVNLCCVALLTLLVSHRDAHTKVLIALGASGVAALLHAIDTVLRTHRDEMVAAAMERTRSRRR